jgi:hypothetical protein
VTSLQGGTTSEPRTKEQHWVSQTASLDN